jgi:hypothetical protein
VERLATGVKKWQQFRRWAQHNLAYGTPARQAQTVMKPLALAALAPAVAYAGLRLLSARNGEE